MRRRDFIKVVAGSAGKVFGNQLGKFAAMRSRLVVCRFCPGFIGIKFANLFSKPLSNIFDPESLDMATGYIKSTIDWSFAAQQKVSTPDDFKKRQSHNRQKGGHLVAISHCFCGIAAIRHSRKARLFSCSFSAVTCHILRHSPSHMRRPILGASVTSHVTPPYKV